MVHTSIAKMTLGQLMKLTMSPTTLIAPNPPKADEDTTFKLQEIESAFSEGHSLIKNDVSVIIFESNYGEPGSPNINEEGFRYFIDTFPNATIYAYSSTDASLKKALSFNEYIIAWHKEKNSDTLASDFNEFSPARMTCKNKFKEEHMTNENVILTARRGSAPALNYPFNNSMDSGLDTPPLYLPSQNEENRNLAPPLTSALSAENLNQIENKKLLL